MASNSPISICIGSYDGTVAALDLATEDDGLLALTARFAQPTHAGAVRSIALNGARLLTGGVDETVRVYDVARRVEAGCLQQHSGTVSAASFFRSGNASFALTGAHDAAVCVWRARDWKCLKKLQGHMAPVLDVAVHPSARLALSTASDRAVLMWSLVKGKAVFSAKVKGASASRVQFAQDGLAYLLAAGTAVTVSNVEGAQTAAFAHKKEVADACFASETSIVTGGEEKVVHVWDSRSGTCVRTGPTHDSRIVGVAAVGDFVLSADAKGGLKVWDTRAGDEARLETCVGGGEMMLTCMTADWKEAPVFAEPTRAKRKRRPKRGVLVEANTPGGAGNDADKGAAAEALKSDAKQNAAEGEASGAADVPHKPKRKRRKKKKNA